jgi:hypothetical protein
VTQETTDSTSAEQPSGAQNTPAEGPKPPPRSRRPAVKPVVLQPDTEFKGVTPDLTKRVARSPRQNPQTPKREGRK